MSGDLIGREALLIAIRAKCMDCSGRCRKEVERCKMKDCPLWPFRNTKAVGKEAERREEINGQIDIYSIIVPREAAV